MLSKFRAPILLVLLITLLSFVGCSGSGRETMTEPPANTEDTREFVVHFEYGNGRTSGYPVKYGKQAFYPLEEPYKENHIFMGWYVDEELTERYDFSKPVTHSFHLYPKFQVDFEELTNLITTETMRGIVTVEVEQYKPDKFLGIDWGKDESTRKAGQGSGVVFVVKEEFALVLTNCHVAVNYSGYSYYDCTVVDYKGNRFPAQLYHSSSKPETAIDPDYDLAVLYIKLGEGAEHEFLPIGLETEDPAVGESVVAVSTPQGQTNAIRYGKVTDYETVSLDDCLPEESNVTFPVMEIDAYTQKGSSGGAILNTERKLVAIHYSGYINSTKGGHAIPITKVREFLDRYVYN